MAGLAERSLENRAAQARLARLAALGKLSDDIIDEQASALEQEASDLDGRLALLRVQLEQAQEDSVPIREIEDACKLLAEGLNAVTFSERRWIIRTLVDTIYADKTAWKMEGRLPVLSAEGSLPAVDRVIEETHSSACSASPMRRTA